MNDNKEFDTIKEYISLNVGVIAETGMTIAGNEVGDWGSIEVVEGDSLDVQCYARHGYPEAQLDWTVLEKENVSVSQVLLHLCFLQYSSNTTDNS